MCLKFLVLYPFTGWHYTLLCLTQWWYFYCWSVETPKADLQPLNSHSARSFLPHYRKDVTYTETECTFLGKSYLAILTAVLQWFVQSMEYRFGMEIAIPPLPTRVLPPQPLQHLKLNSQPNGPRQVFRGFHLRVCKAIKVYLASSRTFLFMMLGIL
mgnify:CR=1 FL=1